MKITKLIAHVSNFLKKKYAKKFLVYHFTANDGDKAINNGRYFGNNANLKASAQYFVDDDVIVQSVEDEYVAYAVGGKKLSGNGGKYHGVCTNYNSINIELCDTNKNGKLDLSNKTRENAIELGKSLVKKYNIPKKRVIRHYDVTGKNCLPIDSTELLTKDGWLSLKDIKVGDCVAQYNSETNEIEFDKVLNVIEPYQAEVLKNRSLEATDNHRMYLVPNSKNSHKYRDVLWGDALDGNKCYLIKNGAVYNGQGLELSDDEIRLLVWIQGDGHYIKTRNGKTSGIEFHLKKKRKISTIIELLNNLEIEYTICNKSDGSTSIRIYDINLYNWSEQWLNDKKFTYNLLEMSNSQFDVFWNELLIVDGNIESNMYSSVPQINLDVIQAVCATKGIRTNKCTLGSIEPTAIVRSSSNYSVGGHIGKKKIEKRNTLVSCVTVPSGYILIRQNGKTFIVGNCPAYFVKDEKAWNEFKNEIFATKTTSSSTTTKKVITYKASVVKSLQKALNSSYKLKLSVDGIIGTKTKTVLKTYVVKNYTKNAYAKWIQQRLKDKGYHIKVDGKFGNDSTSVLKAFQKDNGLTVDGKCGYNTALKLAQN